MLVTTISSYYDDKIDKIVGLFSITSETHSSNINSAYNDALHRIKMASMKEGANAIIGIQVNIYQKDAKLSELLLIGTAVVLKDEYKGSYSKGQIIQ